MKSKIKRSPLTEKVTTRYTDDEFSMVKAKADSYAMPISNYIRDVTVNGSERMVYAKRRMSKAVITANKHVDQLHEILLSTESDSVPKDLLIPFLEEARKECASLWCH